MTMMSKSPLIFWMTLSLLFKANSGVCYNLCHENGYASGLSLNRNLGQPGQN